MRFKSDEERLRVIDTELFGDEIGLELRLSYLDLCSEMYIQGPFLTFYVCVLLLFGP